MDKDLNPNFNIIVDCIAEELDKIQEEAAGKELYSIDLLAIATELFDSFESILNLGIAIHQVILIREKIKSSSAQKGVNITDENIDNILNAISQRVSNMSQPNSDEQ